MPDLGILLERCLPLKADGSLPDPIARSEMERRVCEVLYPSRHRVTTGRNPTYIDTSMITGSVQALGDAGCIRYSAHDGVHGATRVGTDLIHRIVGHIGAARPPSLSGPRGEVKVALVNEDGKEIQVPRSQAAEESARINRIKRNARIEQIRRDLAEEPVTV